MVLACRMAVELRKAVELHKAVGLRKGPEPRKGAEPHMQVHPQVGHIGTREHRAEHMSYSVLSVPKGDPSSRSASMITCLRYHRQAE